MTDPISACRGAFSLFLLHMATANTKSERGKLKVAQMYTVRPPLLVGFAYGFSCTSPTCDYVGCFYPSSPPVPVPPTAHVLGSRLRKETSGRS